jgi:predicted DNA-binding antitoxin AbrB/MazE fold protein
MISQVEAVYENGVFRPLEPLSLEDNQKVTLTIVGEADALDRAHFALPADRWDAFRAALDAPARVIPSLRKLLTEPGVFDGPDAAAR